MRKIINGRKYDTETATALGHAQSNVGRSDFKWWYETLYQKKNGEFFIHGEGNAASKYAERCGDMWGCGERIVPLADNEAREWAERNLTVTVYEAIFGEVDE